MKRQLTYLGLIVSFVLSSTNSNAQFWDTYQQSCGYFGNTLINPGFSYGLQRSVWDSDKGSGFAAPFGRTTLNGSGTTALYWYPFSHVGFVNYYECNIRQYLGQRLGVQFGAGPGFQMNFTGDNYVISDDFEIVNALVYGGEAILQTAEILAPVDVDFALDALANSFFANNLLTTFFTGNVANNTLYNNGLVENSLTDELVKIEKPCLFLWG